MIDKIVELPEQSVIEQEAAEWLVALDRDDKPSSQLLEELTDWMARSKAHRTTLLRLNQFMSTMSLTDLMVPKVQIETNSKPANESKTSLLDKLFSWPVLTGTFASIACVMTLIFTFAQNPDVIESPLFSTNGTLISSIGQQRTIKLADGSKVSLNANSKINVNYSEGARDIHLLRGQAHFDVAHNKSIPFRVYSAQGRVEAVGTAFTVKVKDDSIDLLVTEGIVAVSSTGTLPNNSDLIADIESNLVELGQVSAGQRVVVDTVADISQSLQLVKKARIVDEKSFARLQAWREGLLVFSGETLSEVIKEIFNFTGYEIDVIDDELKDVKVAGSFQANDVDAIFYALESNFPLKVSKVGYQKFEIEAIK